MKSTESVSELNSFTEEVGILSQCNNQQIIKLLSASTKGCLIMSHIKKTISYIVTSYAKFGELFKVILETGPLEEALARTYFLQLIKGIEYLHSIDICHRDIKLENLLLNQESQLVIADFGSASKINIEKGKPLPFNSLLPVGSREYNPPEMHTEKSYYGEKADIFAAGVCLFLMLLGHPPFREASIRDPYYKRLMRADKDEYWKVYKTVNTPPLFKDLFERMVEADIGKRIALKDIYAHPWMAGPVLTPKELKVAMQDRMQTYIKTCLKQARGALKAKRLEQKREICKEKAIIKEKPTAISSGEMRRRIDFESLLADKKTINSPNEKEEQEKKNYDSTFNTSYR